MLTNICKKFKNILKYFHNAMKTPFFTLRSIFAVLSRVVEVIFCICMLFYYWTLFSLKFVLICGQLLLLFIGRILTLSSNKVKHYNFEALSLRRPAAESLPNLRQHNLEWPRWAKESQMIDSGGNFRFMAQNFCPHEKRSKC